MQLKIIEKFSVSKFGNFLLHKFMVCTIFYLLCTIYYVLFVMYYFIFSQCWDFGSKMVSTDWCQQKRILMPLDLAKRLLLSDKYKAYRYQQTRLISLIDPGLGPAWDYTPPLGGGKHPSFFKGPPRKILGGPRPPL